MNEVTEEEREPKEFKLVVGSIFGSSAGRSALVFQLITQKFVKEYDATIEDSYRKLFTIDGEPVVLNVLDTAGDEDYSALRDRYERTCDGFLVVYDVTRRSSFDKLDELLTRYSEIRSMKKNKLPVVICGNKCDCSEDERQVQKSEGQTYADSYGYPFIETSAKERINVEEAFFLVVRTYSLNVNDNHNDKQRNTRHRTDHHTCAIC